MANANFYNVELRDKAGTLKAYLTPKAADVSWQWNRLGGCGRCTIKLQKEYRGIDFLGADDIQIRVRSGSTSKLVYRGWLSGVVPSLAEPESITLNIRGYFDFLKYIIIHDGGDKKTYENMGISAIVESIIDDFVTTPTSITKGTIDAASFSADKLEFRTKVSEALRTLAEIEGGVEYGVDENLVFYWRAQGETLSHKFFIGDNVKLFERRIVWDNLVNKIYFEGGLVNDSPYIKISGAEDSQTRHFLAEGQESNSAITTDGVAARFLSAKLKESAKTPLTLKVKILNTDTRIEDTIPAGRVGIFDADYDQTLKIWGTTANGGDNMVWGTLKNSGSGGIWGGMYKDQISSIKYTLSSTEGRFNIELVFGGSLLDTSAKLKQMDLLLSSLRQRS